MTPYKHISRPVNRVAWTGAMWHVPPAFRAALAQG